MPKSIAFSRIFGTLLIFIYRALSPLLGTTACCTFEVSCSEYALQQLHREPLLKALLNIVRRIGHCW